MPPLLAEPEMIEEICGCDDSHCETCNPEFVSQMRQLDKENRLSSKVFEEAYCLVEQACDQVAAQMQQQGNDQYKQLCEAVGVLRALVRGAVN